MNNEKYLFLLNEIYTNGYTDYILDILSILAVISGICVIISKNPIVSVLHLIALFANVSFYLIIIGLNFIGLSYLIVYIGAVKERNHNEIAAWVKIPLYKVFLIVIKLFQFTNLEFYRGFINVSGRHTTGFSLRRNTNIFKINVFRSYSTQSCSEDFYKWFVGFSDGESNFTIALNKNNEGTVIGATFRFVIELHKDDIEVLEYIRNGLGVNNKIATYGDSCKLVIGHSKDIYKLIEIFDKFKLNTTKYLDYLDFKRAFILYKEEFKEGDRTALLDQILKIKNGMNANRTNFNFPSDHNIVISPHWLLGLIEGEGTFTLDRKEFRPGFYIGLSQVQLPVLEKIKEFLENNLGFDKYSMFKLNNSSCIAITRCENDSKENSKPMVRLLVRNVNVLRNYLIPFLDNMTFISKKGKDFRDFKVICNALYNGIHRNEEIKSLIIKLSYSMNNYRLSTNSDPKKVSEFSHEDLDRIINAKPIIEHLSDGRQVDILTRKEVNSRWTNCVYEIVNNVGEIRLTSTLNEAATILNVDPRTVKRQLESVVALKEGFVEINRGGHPGKRVRRVPVFYPQFVFEKHNN